MRSRSVELPATRALTDVDFTAPLESRFLEDYPAGATYEYGHLRVALEEIVEFARRFDPQPIHVDPQLARQGPFGGLIASGWLTASLCMRLFADHYLTRNASLGSPGIDELRWPAPVRPGDTLHVRITTVEVRASRTKPDRGVVRTRLEGFNQDDRLVLSWRAANLLLRRPA
jgi:acyl dehydratase